MLDNSNRPEMNSGYMLRIDSREQIPAAISTMQAAGVHHRARLLQGLWRGEIALYDVARSTSSGTVKKFLAMVNKPAIVTIGDDDDAPTGPAAFAPTARLFKWARMIVIHAAEGREQEYSELVAIAQFATRLVLVECPSAGLREWLAVARKLAPRSMIRIVVPPPGQQHPQPRSRGALQ